MISENTISELIYFRKERDWEKFHSPKNLSMSISIEASELMEIFQWANDLDLKNVISNRREDIEHEVADLFILLTYLCKDLNINIDDAVQRKILINKQKYPVEKTKGNSIKYDRLK